MTVNGRMLIFGGFDATGIIESGPDFSRQVLQLGSCGIGKIGELPFQFYYGACQTFESYGSDNALLCFSGKGDKKTCHRFKSIIVHFPKQ